MLYLSTLLGKMVTDIEGEDVGRVKDFISHYQEHMPHPKVMALVVKKQRALFSIPISCIAVLIAPTIALKVPSDEIPAYEKTESDILLVRDVLDKQIIDTNGMRVVRVNDLELARINNEFYIANVDVSSIGLLRRLGFGRWFQKCIQRFRKSSGLNVISWDSVELLPSDHLLKLKVSSDRISDLHPADLAEIISDLGRPESNKLIESLNVKTLADALEEVEPDFQASIVESMSDEKVADVLEEMAPDDAADLLGNLPEERSEEILRLMEDDEAADVRKLMQYPVDTAGGIMNTEYIATKPNLTAEEVICILRDTAKDAETIYYIYVTDEESHLLGVFSLRDLVLAQPKTLVSEFMHKRVVSVGLFDDQNDIARAIAKYNLLAVPVVDEANRMHGIVTADDALDKIIPTAWKKHLPSMYY